MTMDETAKVLHLFRAAYPKYYSGMNRVELTEIVSLWYDMFSGYDVGVVLKAVKMYIAGDENGFPPAIGAVRGIITEISHPDLPTPSKAWSDVTHAIENGLYGARQEFEKLHPIIRVAVGSPSQIREWAMMDSDTVQSVVSSNFRKSYQSALQRETNRAKMGLPATGNLGLANNEKGVALA